MGVREPRQHEYLSNNKNTLEIPCDTPMPCRDTIESLDTLISFHTNYTRFYDKKYWNM
jgi:hypothetical protein